ncbi:hypothetical protein ISS05_01650 [Candidatus Woesearchaeota archaeon]|nr:hypothetical protein [Candidatus Woesearchaeota archaeon]
MIEALENAMQELKRVEHLFWVSLKYTRTVDVIRNVVQRLINVFDFGLDSILKHAKENKLVEEIPKNSGLKCDLLKDTFPENEELKEYVDFYLKLRKILNMEYTKKEEYRRHVTMTVNVDGETINVDIDLLKEYYEKSKLFIKFVKAMIGVKREEI